MFNPWILLAVVVAFAVAVTGAGIQGYRLGGDSVRIEWESATIKAKDEAELARQRTADTARKLSGNLQTALGKEKRLNRDLSTSLQAHIRAIPAPPAGCPDPVLTPSLLDDWNRANAGPDSPAAGGLPATGGTAAAPLVAYPTGDDRKSSGGDK